MHCFEHAILRTPGPNFAEGITTVAWAEPPNYARLLDQHGAYADALRRAGLSVEVLPALLDYPDAHFVEDVAVVVPELAIITRPGAEARRGEAEHIVSALGRRRELVRLDSPATLDGGDVLVVQERVLVGLSERSNEAGVQALAAALRPHAYTVTGIPVEAGLHFKSSVNLLGSRELLVTPSFAGRRELADFGQVEVRAADAYAANALRINMCMLVAAGFPRLSSALADRDVELIELDMSEVEKMDGGLTCLSLRM